MGRRLTIVVADDEVDTRKYFQLFLSRLGHDVRAAADRRAADRAPGGGAIMPIRKERAGKSSRTGPVRRKKTGAAAARVPLPQTRDSVADVWGPRTPYEGDWPARVDEQVDEEPDRWVQ